MIRYKAFQLTLKTLHYEIAMWFAESIIKVWGFFLPIVLPHCMIDYWHHPVVRPSATLCIVAFRRFESGYRMHKLYTSVACP